MIRTLTDYKTGEKFRIVAINHCLPCFGEDGIMYFWLTNLYYSEFDIPRDDCRILDLEQKIGIKPIVFPNRETFDRWDNEWSNFKSLEDIEDYINKQDYED